MIDKEITKNMNVRLKTENESNYLEIENSNKNDISIIFSFKAFLFTFIYFYNKGLKVRCIVSFITTAILPIKYYFCIGLILGFIESKNINNKVKSSTRNFIISCCLLLVFCVIKILEVKYLYYM